MKKLLLILIKNTTMKKILLILLCLPLMILAQQTYVPDDNFEAFLENNGMGNGILNDDYVTTANINSVTFSDVSSQNISNLTGIEDFTAITILWCQNNQLASLDVSQNIALSQLTCSSNQLTSLDVSNNTTLTRLDCFNNELTSLDVSQNTALWGLGCGNNTLTSLDVIQNTALTDLHCENNQLTSLDVSQNTALTELYCSDNELTSLDVSNNIALTWLYCGMNQLTSLDVRNGNNTNFTLLGISTFNCTGNSNLICINVDDATWSTSNWTNIDPQHYFSNNCPPPSAIEEHTTNKELLRTIDVLGRETKHKPLFYIYDDGTVEKRITIE